METNNIESYLNSFGKQVVNRAKGGLKRKGKGGGPLELSIKFKLERSKKGFSVQFFMLDYGTYVDKGVSGTKVRQQYKNYLDKVVSSPHKYRNAKGHSQPPSSALDKWTIKKGLAPRDAKGRFIKRKTLTYLIARSIGRNGIKGISFFQKPLSLGMKQFGKHLLQNVKEDIKSELHNITIS